MLALRGPIRRVAHVRTQDGEQSQAAEEGKGGHGWRGRWVNGDDGQAGFIERGFLHTQVVIVVRFHRRWLSAVEG